MALFRKFERGGKAASAAAVELESILENLNNVLNTRRGFGSPLRDFGIRDLSEHNNREDIALAVIDEVRQCISRYEPRVELLDIVYNNDNDPLHLSFTLRCRITENNRELSVVFDTIYGKIDVG